MTLWSAAPRIVIKVVIKTLPDYIFGAKLLNPGEPFDITSNSWLPDYLDPDQSLDSLLETGGMFPTLTTRSTRAAGRVVGQAVELPEHQRTRGQSAAYAFPVREQSHVDHVSTRHPPAADSTVEQLCDAALHGRAPIPTRRPYLFSGVGRQGTGEVSSGRSRPV